MYFNTNEETNKQTNKQTNTRITITIAIISGAQAKAQKDGMSLRILQALMGDKKGTPRILFCLSRQQTGLWGVSLHFLLAISKRRLIPKTEFSLPQLHAGGDHFQTTHCINVLFKGALQTP